jgi:hypothetical protein
MNRVLTCWHCQDVIGVYEPMIVLSAGQVRTTSRALEHDLDPAIDECYHHDCYASAHCQGPPL